MHKLSRFLPFAAFVICVCATIATLLGGIDTPVAAATAPRPTLPLAFERNDGQHPSDIRFAARGAGYTFGFTDSEVHMSLRGDRESHVALRLLGSSRRPVGESPLDGVVHYLRGTQPREWKIDIPTFARVRYERTWPGIDVLFYGNGQQLEYDVVLAPYADLNLVKLTADGAASTRVEPDGSLRIGTGGRVLEFSKPVAYQDIAGRRRNVDARYILEGNTIGFAAGAYDPAHQLVIDPVLVFSTYLGSTNADQVRDVAVDLAGHVYVTGGARSTDFPTTPGAYRRTHPSGGPVGDFDVFVTKIHRDGTRFIYSTFIGGSEMSFGSAIAVDPEGNAYVGGQTRAPGTGFPTTPGAFQRDSRGGPIEGTDAFALKLSTSGSSLVWSTLLGGTHDESLYDIAVDVSGAPVLAGMTASGDFPATAGVLDNTNLTGENAGFVTKINRTGSGLHYSQFVARAARGVALNAGRGYIVGTADSGAPLPTTTTNAIQRTPGGREDAFLFIVNSGGGAEYLSYFGGPEQDDGAKVAVDPNGFIYIGGSTEGSFPTTANAGAPSPSGGLDAFVVGLTLTGNSRRFATYVGGTGNDSVTGIDVDLGGFPLITGETTSSTFPAGIRRTYGPRGSTDVFVARLYASIGFVDWYALFGGNSTDVPYGIASHSTGRHAVGGLTWSPDFPTQAALDSANTCTPAWDCVDGFVTMISELDRPRVFRETETVLWAADADRFGAWQLEDDPTAAGGKRVRHPNAGAPRVTTPLAAPTDYIEFTVPGDPGADFAFWLRGRADGNDYSNDSVWVQFSNTNDTSGNPIFRIGTTQAMNVTLEECVGCNPKSWGWQDGSFGIKVAPLLLYSNGQPLTIRIQTREDGIAIDQVLIDRVGDGVETDPATRERDGYFPHAPGYQKEDDTILPRTVTGGGGGAIVVYTGVDSPQLRGSWRVVPDAAAAGGVRLHQPDAGAPKVTTPLANPTHFVDYTINVEAGVAYGFWLRGRADRDDPYNDSVYIQFSNSNFPIGTTSAMAVNLERCSGVGLTGWAWRTGHWCVSTNAAERVQFATSGPQTLRIQAREDGISIDQIVLGTGNYLEGPPAVAIVPR